MPIVVRPYHGESTEGRIQSRRRQLLDTAFMRMAGGWKRITIGSLCRDAKLNKRYFYENFADLDALAGALVDDLSAQLIDIGIRTANEARTGGLPKDALENKVLAAVIGFLIDEPGRARVLFTEVANSSSMIWQR